MGCFPTAADIIMGLSQRQYAGLLQAAGFTAITITPTREAGPGLHSAIIQAAKPATRHP